MSRAYSRCPRLFACNGCPSGRHAPGTSDYSFAKTKPKSAYLRKAVRDRIIAVNTRRICRYRRYPLYSSLGPTDKSGW